MALARMAQGGKVMASNENAVDVSLPGGKERDSESRLM